MVFLARYQKKIQKYYKTKMGPLCAIDKMEYTKNHE